MDITNVDVGHHGNIYILSLFFRFLILISIGDHEGGPDGMDFDSEGNLLVANWGGAHIEVFGPSGGSPIERIQCPFSNPSNVHFRPDSWQIFVTEHDSDSLWSFEWKHKGAKQFCDL